MNKTKVDFAYLIDSFILWHTRLGHIVASTMKKMLDCDMVAYNVNDAY